MRRLFGTDGIRATAGAPPLDAKTVYAIGMALAHSLRKISTAPRVLLGMDTRESSGWIAATLTAGLRQAGAAVENAGVVTTPAVAFLTAKHGFSAGIVISASHNPWQDNGIKIFGGDGYKLADAVEMADRRRDLPASGDGGAAGAEGHERTGGERGGPRGVHPLSAGGCAGAEAGRAQGGDRLRERSGELDCAATVRRAGRRGDRDARVAGRAEHQRAVRGSAREDGGGGGGAAHADMGITFDGDADRALFADANGNVVNGDAVMLLAARDMQARGLLAGMWSWRRR